MDDGSVEVGFNPGAVFQVVDLSTNVPSITQRVRIVLSLSGSGGSAVEWYYRPKDSSWTTGTLIGMANSTPSHLSQETVVITDSAQEIEVKTRNVSGPTANLKVSGWFDPLEF